MLGCRCRRGRGGFRGFGRSRGRGGFRRAGLGAFDIGLDDAATRAGAGDAGKVDALFGGDPAGTMQFTVRREIYKHLERIVDAFEDVANEIDGIVVDHA